MFVMCAGIDQVFLIADFFKILKTREEYGFLLSPPEEGTVNSKEQKTRFFCQNDVQELHLWIFLPGFQSIHRNKILVQVTTFLSL
jgi:hypothetical protein